MVDETKDDITLCPVIDLVRYKIQKEIDSNITEVERLILQNLLKLYDDETVVIKWSKKDMLVKMKDGSDIPTELLIPPELADSENVEIIIAPQKDGLKPQVSGSLD